ncbi:MAG: hypothetical protein HC817_00970 [Saprospiraceae bacterium]|nr:hypothetical protein [Saprospiraceae bacterium]
MDEMENQKDNTWVMLAMVLSHEPNKVIFDDFEAWLNDSSDNRETYNDAKYIWSSKKPAKGINQPFDSVKAFERLDKKSTQKLWEV